MQKLFFNYIDSPYIRIKNLQDKNSSDLEKNSIGKSENINKGKNNNKITGTKRLIKLILFLLLIITNILIYYYKDNFSYKEMLQNKEDKITVFETEKNKNEITNEKLIIEEEKKGNNKSILYSKFGLNINKEIDFDEPLLKQDSPLISDFEKNITFTKNNFMKLFDKYWNMDKYNNIYNKDNLIIDLNTDGSDINNKFPLLKVSYRQKKSVFKENADLQTLIDLRYIPLIRTKWEKEIKEMTIKDGIIGMNYVISSYSKTPTYFMSDRESFEKKFIFKNKEGNAFYIIATSIPDNLFEVRKGYVRVFNYINFNKVVDEGDYFGFYYINQSDFKMFIPKFLFNAYLPYGYKNRHSKFEKFASEVKYNKQTKSIILKYKNSNIN